MHVAFTPEVIDLTYQGYIALIVAALLWNGCGEEPSPSDLRVTEPIVQGVITQIGGHGNAYTSVLSSEYDELGFRAGTPVQLVLADTAFTLLLGEDYTSVPSGEPVAVLHREGLTLAVRDEEFVTRFAVAVGDTFRLYPVAGPR